MTNEVEIPFPDAPQSSHGCCLENLRIPSNPWQQLQPTQTHTIVAGVAAYCIYDYCRQILILVALSRTMVLRSHLF